MEWRLIGCKIDEEVTAGSIRAVVGDEDGLEVPGGGVDFVCAHPAFEITNPNRPFQIRLLMYTLKREYVQIPGLALITVLPSVVLALCWLGRSG